MESEQDTSPLEESGASATPQGEENVEASEPLQVQVTEDAPKDVQQQAGGGMKAEAFPEQPTTGSLEEPMADDDEGSATLATKEIEPAVKESQPITDLELIQAEVFGHGAGVMASEGSSTAQSQPVISEDLQRLRDLVLATRGTKAQLPPGWDDAEVEHRSGGEAGVPQSNAVTVEKQTYELEGKSLIDSAIAKVGAEVSDSESEAGSSSASSTNSGDDDDSSDSGSDLDEDIKQALQKKSGNGGYNSDEDDEDDGEAGCSVSKARGPATKNEVVDASFDPPPYAIVPDGKDVRLMGEVHAIVDNVVVVSQQTGMAPGGEQGVRSRYGAGGSEVQPRPPVDRQGRVGAQEGEYSVLDTGSLLAFEDRNVLGIVYETFGSVQGPLYAVRYPTASSIDSEIVYVGKPVGYVPVDSTYVLTRALRALGKGSDASNLYDEEVGDDEREFSDDEAEAMNKAARKAAKKGVDKNMDASGAANGKGRKRGPNDQGRGPASNMAPGVRHSLPPRPVGMPAMAAHRDMDQTVSSGRALPLPYDDEEGQSGGGGGGVQTGAEATVVLPTLHVSMLPQSHSSAHQASTPTHPAFQHIRPSGQTSNPGRGRGRGRGGPLGAGIPGGGSTHGAFNPAFAHPTTAANWALPGNMHAQQGVQPSQHAYSQQYPSPYGQSAGPSAWQAQYNSGTAGQAYTQQPYQQPQAYASQQQQSQMPYAQYAYVPMTHSQGGTTAQAQAVSGDSLGSYDPNQPQMALTPQAPTGTTWPTRHPPAWQQ